MNTVLWVYVGFSMLAPVQTTTKGKLRFNIKIKYSNKHARRNGSVVLSSHPTHTEKNFIILATAVTVKLQDYQLAK